MVINPPWATPMQCMTKHLDITWKFIIVIDEFVYIGPDYTPGLLQSSSVGRHVRQCYQKILAAFIIMEKFIQHFRSETFQIKEPIIMPQPACTDAGMGEQHRSVCHLLKRYHIEHRNVVHDKLPIELFPAKILSDFTYVRLYVSHVVISKQKGYILRMLLLES